MFGHIIDLSVYDMLRTKSVAICIFKWIGLNIDFKFKKKNEKNILIL